MFHLTGITDEGGGSWETQKRLIETLNLDPELRFVDGKPFWQLPPKRFQQIISDLESMGKNPCCISSTIANWAKQPTEEGFLRSIEEAKVLAERMTLIGAPMVRIMAFAIIQGKSISEQNLGWRIESLKYLAEIFINKGIQVVVENCQSYSGMHPDCMEEILTAIPEISPLIDFGNPVFTRNYKSTDPNVRQNPLYWVRAFSYCVKHIHIKDAIFGYWRPNEVFPKAFFTLPGQGHVGVEACLATLLNNKYNGYVSIESHTKAVFHEGIAEVSEDDLFDNFVLYYRTLERIIQELTKKRDEMSHEKMML